MSNLKEKFQESKTVLVFDTETTGLADDAKLTQFSAVKCNVVSENGTIKLIPIEYFDTYFNPEEKLSDIVIEKTGITQEIVDAAPTELQIGATVLDYFCNSADIVVAHNAPFDLKKMFHMAKRIGYPYKEPFCIDTLAVARTLLKKGKDVANHQNGTLFQYVETNNLGISYEEMFHEKPDLSFHNSLDDTKATARVLGYLINAFDKKVQRNLAYAHCKPNPHKPSEKRIKLVITNEPTMNNAIFWDIIQASWMHKADKKSQAFFEETDIKNLEEQVMNKYANRFHAEDMVDLGKKWWKYETTKGM